MKKLTFWMPFFFLAVLADLSAQTKREDKWQAGINALKETDFIKTYVDYKERMEKNINQFQVDMTEKGLSDEQIEAVAASYEDVAERFDKVLNQLKTDFTDPDNRKLLARSPDRFTREYAPDLEKAYQAYMNGCQLKIDRLTGANSGAALGIGEVQMLLAAGNMIYKAIEAHQAKMAKLSAAFFEQNFISDLRLKRWEEFSSSN